MMKKLLVAYSTNCGSTEMAAQVIGDTLGGGGIEVEVKNIGDVTGISGYSAVVLGGPMILGWHRKARAFFRKYKDDLVTIPTALFFTAMEVTGDQTEEMSFPVFIDPEVLKEPANHERLSFKEKQTTLTRYFKPIRRLCLTVRPVGAAFFAGKLDYQALKILQMLFVMLVIQAKPGDYRDREKIQKWAETIKPLLVS